MSGCSACRSLGHRFYRVSHCPTPSLWRPKIPWMPPDSTRSTLWPPLSRLDAFVLSSSSFFSHSGHSVALWRLPGTFILSPGTSGSSHSGRSRTCSNTFRSFCNRSLTSSSRPEAPDACVSCSDKLVFKAVSALLSASSRTFGDLDLRICRRLWKCW